MNQKIWFVFCICVLKSSRQHSIVHPLDESYKLYFMADPLHILKKIRNFLISKLTLTLPPEKVLKYLLPFNSVCVDVIKKNCTEESKAF